MISRVVKENAMKKDSCGRESGARRSRGNEEAGRGWGAVNQREKVQKMRKEKEGGGRRISV